jgi:signal transduction histidine kinase
MARTLLPRSLLGQMLLSVALALLATQTLSVVLQYRAAEQRREIRAIHQLAFQLVADPRSTRRPPGTRGSGGRRGGGAEWWRQLPVERIATSPLRQGEVHDSEREALLREVLTDQGIEPADLVITVRDLWADAYTRQRLNALRQRGELPEWAEEDKLLVAGLRRTGESTYAVARVPRWDGDDWQLTSIITQTLVLYLVLVGGLALLLRRITRPLAALTARVETFAANPTTEGQVQPSGPQDMRRLIVAHNAMEGRIAALLDEKDVMLGAIGHDLKTPLATLRVRIESVEDAAERDKMAAGIEDITRSLDDILSLARVGRPSDPLERTELSALVASVVEEYEDMGEPVTLGDTQRVSMALRATWLRRGLRNLIENALRYGERAHVTLLREGREAVIRIEDEGPGIAAGEIAAMLEPFARGESSRNRETGGAGLGLTLARAIAEQHGGRLVLANRAPGTGRGLVAELRLPLD